MTDEAKALVERLRQVSSVLFDDYGDGTHAVEDYALPGKAADLIETQSREIGRLREVLGFAMRTLEAEGFREDGPTMTRIRAALAGDSHDQ